MFTPTNEQLNPSTRPTSDGLRADWIPLEVGTYTVHVTFGGNAVPGSPFRVKCYDPKKITITPPTNDSIVRKTTRFLSEFRNHLNFLFSFSKAKRKQKNNSIFLK